MANLISFRNVTIGLLVALQCLKASADNVQAAVAANFITPMRELATKFESTTTHKLIPSFASSGKFYAQIRHGAPYDVFFSADQDKPQQLIDDGFAVAHSRFTYAFGTLALWSSQVNGVEGPNVLHSGNFNKLAIANPKLAPYGVAAMEVLKALSLAPKMNNKLVLGENLAQTYQFVSSGNADLGFVALGQIVENGKLRDGSAWIVPGNLYSPIRQDAVLLQRGQNNAGAKALLEFMQGECAADIIRRFGYSTTQIATGS